MPLARRTNKGISAAAVILLVFVVVFAGAIAYLMSPPQSTATTKTYFEGENLDLGPYKLWHVGVPINTEGNLRLSLTSNGVVRFYARSGDRYLMDRTGSGHEEFVMQVDPSMGIVEVALVNLQNATISIGNLTCVLTP